MGLEAASFISGLVATNPVGASDPKSQGDDHLRLIKSVLLASFPNINAVVNATPAQLNLLVGLTGLTGNGLSLVTANNPSITGTALINGDAVGGIRAAYKAADTDRTNTTTFADDPDLVVGLVSGGVYAYEMHEIFLDVTSVTQAYKKAIVFTGTRDIHRAILQEANNNPLTDYAGSDDSAGTLETGRFTFPINSNSPCVCKTWGLIRTTSAGNLKLQWAQGVSNANATRLRQGSFLLARRIA